MADSKQNWGIVGYRNFTDGARFDRELAALVETRGAPARVVSGGAAGADTLAAGWAKSRGLPLVEHLPATADAYGFKARNTLIVQDSDLIVAFLSPKSRGTHDTLNKARRAKKPVVVIAVD
jgi:predicted Rossmann fold nucleotide-binding protein DprA/Smf involved in DNA uptake